MRRIFTYTVDEKYSGRLVKDVLKNKFLMSSGLITHLKKYDEGITVNGEKRFVNYKLNKGDILKILIYEGASKNIEPKLGELDILFEDEDLIAINKSYDMPTHTSIGHHEDTLANAVLYHLNKSGEEHTFHAVTRLDKDTSGVVLIAKNRYAHDLLSNQLRLGKIEKTYVAIICGKLSGSGIIDAKIKREEQSIIKRTVAADGQEAITEYKVLETFDDFSYVELHPKTGRTHQIRVHMASIGHPLVGDVMYGGERTAKRHLLHCRTLSFMHPITYEKIIIEADLPGDFEEFKKSHQKA